MSEARSFSYKSARSGSLVVGILLVLLTEGTAIHLWTYSKNVWIAFALDAMTLITLGWIIAEYVAIGTGRIRVRDDAIELEVGRQFDMTLPRNAVADVARPDWRDLPQKGMPEAADYLHLMRSATPNVLITLREALPIKRPLMAPRQIRRIGLHVDDPDGFITACSAHFQQTEYERSSTL